MQSQVHGLAGTSGEGEGRLGCECGERAGVRATCSYVRPGREPLQAERPSPATSTPLAHHLAGVVQTVTRADSGSTPVVASPITSSPSRSCSSPSTTPRTPRGRSPTRGARPPPVREDAQLLLPASAQRVRVRASRRPQRVPGVQSARNAHVGRRSLGSTTPPPGRGRCAPACGPRRTPRPSPAVRAG